MAKSGSGPVPFSLDDPSGDGAPEAGGVDGDGAGELLQGAELCPQGIPFLHRGQGLFRQELDPGERVIEIDLDHIRLGLGSLLSIGGR